VNAAGAADSHNKLLLLGTRNLQAISHRIAQLVGGGTSGAGDRIIPFHCATPPPLQAYRKGVIAATLGMLAEEDAGIVDAEFRAMDEGIPTVSIKLQAPADWGAAMFVWEVATALTCSLLRVNPFHPSETDRGSNRLLRVVEDLAAHRELPALRPRALANGLQLYAEGETRYQISTLNVFEALRSFFELRRANSYIAIHGFIDGNDPTVQSALLRLRDKLTSAPDIPVALTAGTRALHCFDERYNGQHPSNALFLILTTETACDLDIPGAGYTFGQLRMAFAWRNSRCCNRANSVSCAFISLPASKAASPNSNSSFTRP